MHETKHTPGPWTYQPTAGNHDFLIYPTETDGRDVALSYGGSEANARLIAAAPELLAALETLIDRASALDQSATHEGLQNCDALATARAAITKATEE